MYTKLLTTPVTRSLVRRQIRKLSPYVSLTYQKLHTSETLSLSPLYELRSYQAPPKDFKTLVDLFNSHIDKRTRHSKLVCFWTAEIGDFLWQVVHLWEYASLSERARVRKALAQDEAWAAEFLTESMPRMRVMKNYLVVPSPSTKLDLEFTNNADAVYVLQTLSNAEKQTSVPKSMTQDERLIGRFTTVLGPTNTEFRLWRYLNIDSVTQEWLHRAKECPTDGSSLLLYPTSFSPVK